MQPEAYGLTPIAESEQWRVEPSRYDTSIYLWKKAAPGKPRTYTHLNFRSADQVRELRDVLTRWLELVDVD